MMRHHGMSWYFIGHSGTRWDLTHIYETWWDMIVHRHKYLHMKFGIWDIIVHIPVGPQSDPRGGNKPISLTPH